MTKISDSQSPMILPPAADSAETVAETVNGLSNEIFIDPEVTNTQAFIDLANSRMSDLNLGAQVMQGELNRLFTSGRESLVSFPQNPVAASLAGPIPQSSIFSSPSPFPGYGTQGRTIAEGQLGFSFGGVDSRTQGNLGSGYFQGGTFVGARGRAFGDFDWQNRSARVGFEAEVGVRAHYEGGFSTPSSAPVGADGQFSADGFVGGRAEANAEISLNENSPRVAVNGEVFEGARAGFDGGAGLSIDGNRYVGTHYGAEGWSGVGAGGNIDIGFKDGKFRFDITGGLALGIGGKVSLGFEVDFKNILKLSQKFINKLTNAAGDVGKGIFKGLKGAGGGLFKGLTGAGKGMGSLASKGGDALKDAGNAVVNTGKKAWKSAKDFIGL